MQREDEQPDGGPRRWRRIARAASWSLLALVALTATWLLVTGLIARSQLDDARAELPRLRQALLHGQTAPAATLADRIRQQSHRAHALTTGPAWWVAAHLPGLGSPLDTARTITAQADVVGQRVLPAVVSLVTRVQQLPRPHNATVDLQPIAELAPTLDAAARTAGISLDRVQQTAPSWLSPVAGARAAFSRQLTQLTGELTGADRAVRLVLPMLGEHAPQRYFVGFLNEAESRGVGGIPGQFAIVTASDGHLTFDHFGSDVDLAGVRATGVTLAPDFQRRYGQDDPTGLLQNSDVSPDFRDAAPIWAAMWQAKSGQRIDGALAVDPTALSYLLRVTGPAALPGGGTLSAQTVVALTQSTQYRLFPGTTASALLARKAYLTALAKAVAARLTAGGSATGLIRALSAAADQRRLVLWSRDPGLEGQLLAARWAGAIGAPAGTPFTGFVVTNGSGSKLDYYLRTAAVYRRASCAAGSATATYTVSNGAPTSGLPPYVTVRLDKVPPGARPGDDLIILTYYASVGARIAGVTVDGAPVTATVLPERGLTTATFSFELPAGQSRRVVVRVAEPAATAAPRVLVQPMVHPTAVAVHAASCSQAGN